MRKTNFSLLRRGSVVPENEALFRGSVLLFFEISSNGIRFPLHAFILNLMLSLSVAITFVAFLVEVTLILPQDSHGFSGKLYCAPRLTLSLLVELAAQLTHVVGSVLLLFGAVKRRKFLCYLYVACSMVSFLIATAIRTAQFFFCEEKYNACRWPKVRMELPVYFKLLLMWLVCQLFWYWLVFSFVVAQLEWFKTLQVEEEIVVVAPNTPNISVARSFTSTKRNLRARINELLR